MSSCRRVRTLHDVGMAAAAATALLLLACTTTGAGTGAWSPGNTPIAFGWTSNDGGITGTLSATADDGAVFRGPFVQVTRTVVTDAFGPRWTALARSGVWPASPDITFWKRYSGQVVADLEGPNRLQLHCVFQLDRPAAGMAGGRHRRWQG